MLVLSRKPGEIIQVGPDISIQVVRISHGRTRIGISAPRHMNIVRGELLLIPEVPPEPPSREQQAPAA